MAASSSSTAPYTGEWEHDVFLCFRGDDTRHGFTSHLLDALSHRQIRTFIDYKLEKTESIDELLSILKRSALSVVVFSENFADSSWCLDEVATIARRMTESGHRVLPVFYKVDPSDVTADSKAYAASIDRKHKGRNTYVEDKKRWMDALKAVTNFSGHTSEDIKIESELIKAIVKDVQKQLINMSSSVKYDNLVAMDLRIFEVEELLAMDQIDDTYIIGLWGMGGVGKTTLARACYERITSANKGFKYLFVPDINEKCEKNHGVEEIVRKLYSKLLNENNIDREDLSIAFREERLLPRLRVFIVLDNVETSEQLEQLALGHVFDLNKVFASGSRIMVTTRNRKVLQNVTSKIYNVECLNDEESTRLFSLHAVKQGCSQDNWKNEYRLVATSYCKGNPLALKILGGALRNEDMHYWKSFLSGLRQTGNLEIHNILRSSYDKLGAAEKKIFLDVACLLYGISRCRLVEYMMALVPSSYATIKDLIDKSLLTCVPDENGEKIEVHDLLKEMAWNIVNEEGNRRILIDPNDIHQLLSTKNQYFINAKHPVKSFFNFFKAIARRKIREVVKNHRNGCNPSEEHRAIIEGIHLNCRKKEMYLEADAFEGMNSLTFLKIWNKEKRESDLPFFLAARCEVKFLSSDFLSSELNFLSGELEFLSNELRWLEWDEYPSKFLPSKFCPQHLVHLKINFSPIQRCWKGYDQPQLVNLMVLDLSLCYNLIAIPNISRSSSLEELLLKGCSSLVEVPSHVQYLTKLITLDLSQCQKLKRLPPKLESESLKHVRMRYCNSITNCPEIISRELVELDLSWTTIEELPSEIYNVKQDGVLSLSGENITKFPAITTSLKTFSLTDTSIREIDLSDCHQHQTSSELILPRFYELQLIGNEELQTLSKNIWKMVSYKLYIWESPLIESLPEISEPVIGLAYLQISYCESLKSLPSSIGNIKSLKQLFLYKTDIKSLPSSIQELRELDKIFMQHCKSLETIPSDIYKILNLKYLVVANCERIQYLPELPPNLRVLNVSGCNSLQALPSNTCKLVHLWTIHFQDCPQLDQTIPAEIVANFLVQASLASSPKRQVVCSRSELPDWFMYKSMNSSVKVELPHQPMIMKGIALGLVFSSRSGEDIRCDCKVGNTIIASWSSYVIGVKGENSQEKLWLGSDKWDVGSKEDEAWYVKYAGLSVSFYFYEEDDKEIEIKECGVSLIY